MAALDQPSVRPLRLNGRLATVTAAAGGRDLVEERLRDLGDLDIRVFGEVSVRHRGHVVPVPGGRQRSLLALLALMAGKEVGRDALARQMLGHGAGRPAAAVQVCVSRLRRAMGAAGGAVVTTANGYRLEVDPSQVDALRLAAAVTSGRDGDIEVDALDRALSEWRGPAFGGAHRSAHLELEEQRLLDLRLEGTIALVEALRSQGRVAQALQVVDEAERWAFDEPVLACLREELLVVVGRGRSALRDASPGPSGDHTISSTVVGLAPVPVRVEAATWPEPLVRAGARPLVGPTHQAVVHSVRRPRPPQLTVVVGGAGRGKTATAAAWARAWGQRGRVTRYLGLDDTGADDRMLLDLRDELAGADPGRLRLAVVLDDVDALATRQVESAFDLVRGLVAAEVPVLLAGLPALPDSTWGRLLAWTASADGCDRHDLPSLEPTDVRALLADAGRRLDPQDFDDLVEEVWAATAGNAMAVAAVAGLVDAVPVGRHPADQVPVLLPEVAHARLAPLRADARSAMLAVAVLDADRVSPVAVGAVGALAVDATVEALGELERADLVVTESDGWVRAPHPLYRGAILASLDPLDRRRLHLRASEALEQLGDPIGVALQACRAAPLVDPVAAAREALLVLRRAPSELPAAQGLAVAEAARSALEPVTAPPLELRAGLALARASHLEALGRRDEAEEAHDEAFAAVERTDRADLIAAAAVGTEVLGRRSDRSPALDRLRVAADQLEDLGATEELQAVLTSLVAELFSAGHEVPPELVARLRAATVPGGPVGPDELALVDTCTEWSRPIGAVPPPPSRAWSPSEPSTPDGRRRRSLSPAQLAVASALRSGRLDDVRAATTTLERLVRREPAPRARWFLLVQASALELAAGRTGPSAELMAEATELGVRYGLTDAVQSATAAAIARCLAEGTHGTSVGDALGSLSAYGSAMDALDHVPAVVAGAALIAAETGDPGAGELLWSFLDEMTVGRHMPYRVVGLALAAEAAHVLDDREAAARIITAFEPYRGELVVLGVGVTCLGPATRPLALAAATAGDRGLATEAAEASLEWATHWKAGLWIDRSREAVERVATHPRLV